MNGTLSTFCRMLGRIAGPLLLTGLATASPPQEINGCIVAPGTDCRHVHTGLKYSNLVGADLSGGVDDHCP